MSRHSTILDGAARLHGWDENLAFSTGVVARTTPDTIKRLVTSCISVRPVFYPDHRQKLGVDYIATLRRGAEVYIDHKVRRPGCSSYWRGGCEELALETWSVMPENGGSGRVGWTLDESKVTDYTLHTFDPADSRAAYLLPFQLLRIVFRKYQKQWASRYFVDVQKTHRGHQRWRSECVFVPADVVLDALRAAMESRD